MGKRKNEGQAALALPEASPEGGGQAASDGVELREGDRVKVGAGGFPSLGLVEGDELIARPMVASPSTCRPESLRKLTPTTGRPTVPIPPDTLDLARKIASPEAVAIFDRRAAAPEVCDLPPADDGPLPRPKTPAARLKARREALDGLRKQHASHLDPACDMPSKPERFALLSKHPNGAIWLSTHEAPDEACAYLSDDDSGFDGRELYDLETADTYEVVKAYTARLVVA